MVPNGTFPKISAAPRSIGGLRMSKSVVLAFALCLPCGLAAAQYPAPGPRPGGMPPSQPGGEEKEEGPAEQAPEEPEKEQTLQPLPGFARQREKQLQFLELAGYLRWRGELYHNFNLGFHEASVGPMPNPSPATPFAESADCFPTPAENTTVVRPACNDNLSTANMRLRLEPTINVSEQV